MAQIKLTLPLSIGGLLGHPITKQQHWAHCIIDTKTYVDELYLYARDRGMSELQEFFFLRATEYLWHAYYCADPNDKEAWERFDAEQDLRFVWRECIGRFRWGESLDSLKLSNWHKKLYGCIQKTMNRRGEHYVEEAIKRGGDPIVIAIDRMQEMLECGRDEACWGIVDYESAALFPIEGQSMAMEWAEEEAKLWLTKVYDYHPEPREVAVTYTGEDARECLRSAIRNVTGHATLMVQWLIERTYLDSAGVDPDVVKLRLANDAIDAARDLTTELFNETGSGLLQMYEAKYRELVRAPKKRFIYDALKLIVEEINRQARKHGARKRSLSANTLYQYVRKGHYYSTKYDWDEEGDEAYYQSIDDEVGAMRDPSLIWKACFRAVFPLFLERAV